MCVNITSYVQGPQLRTFYVDHGQSWVTVQSLKDPLRCFCLTFDKLPCHPFIINKANIKPTAPQTQVAFEPGSHFGAQSVNRHSWLENDVMGSFLQTWPAPSQRCTCLRPCSSERRGDKSITITQDLQPQFPCWDWLSLLIMCRFNHCRDPVWQCLDSPPTTVTKPLADYDIHMLITPFILRTWGSEMSRWLVLHGLTWLGGRGSFTAELNFVSVM